VPLKQQYLRKKMKGPLGAMVFEDWCEVNNVFDPTTVTV